MTGGPGGPATCHTVIPCHPLLLLDGYVVGAWKGLNGGYAFLDLPGAEVTVVWSWGLDREPPRGASTLVSSIRFVRADELLPRMGRRCCVSRVAPPSDQVPCT